jgi:hypothetical protein
MVRISLRPYGSSTPETPETQWVWKKGMAERSFGTDMAGEAFVCKGRRVWFWSVTASNDKTLRGEALTRGAAIQGAEKAIETIESRP